MKLLVFDTETSGLPEGRETSINDTEKWPYILQFSFILYDTLSAEILDSMNEFIYIKDYVNINEKSMEIHKITREICKDKGIDISEALNNFYSALSKCNLVIAHNIEFDKNLVLVESIRNDIENGFKTNLPIHCTMKSNINLCKIERINKFGEKYYKYPSLSELYQHLFKIVPNGLHNSMVDVLLCLRSFVILNTGHDVLTRESISDLFWKYKINSGGREVKHFNIS